MLVVKAPLGPQSFGQVSFNILDEIFSSRDDVAFFPESGHFRESDLAAFDPSPRFLESIRNAYKNRWKFSKDDKSLRLWHLSGSENQLTRRQILYTFHETSSLTEVEKKIAPFSEEGVFVSSNYTANLFKGAGLNVRVAHPGFDPRIKILNRVYFPNEIHFGLMGKFEKRKNTARIINLWAKKYGNNPKYRLTCLVYNNFVSPEINQQLIGAALEGRQYWNINFLSYLPKNSMVNDFLSSIDIDLTGLSGGEGWNLPAFNATCLGKWSIVLNATAHKDWATKENSILVEPNGQFGAEDGMFFAKNSEFNVGDFYSFSEEDFYKSCEIAEARKNIHNFVGASLQHKFSYKKTVQTLLS